MTSIRPDVVALTIYGAARWCPRWDLPVLYDLTQTSSRVRLVAKDVDTGDEVLNLDSDATGITLAPTIFDGLVPTLIESDRLTFEGVDFTAKCAGARVGDKIELVGTLTNDGTYTVAEVVGATVLRVEEALTSEAAQGLADISRPASFQVNLTEAQTAALAFECAAYDVRINVGGAGADRWWEGTITLSPGVGS